MVFKKYYNFLNVFSKYNSNTFLEYRLYNYKIELELNYRPKDLGYNLLYKILFNELKIIRKYILENLFKGFIKVNFNF